MRRLDLPTRGGGWEWLVTSSSSILKIISETGSFVICSSQDKSYKERMRELLGMGRAYHVPSSLQGLTLPSSPRPSRYRPSPKAFLLHLSGPVVS